MAVKPGYKQTEVGVIPEEWEVKSLSELSVLYQPQTISAKLFTETGFPVYGANGVVGHYHSANHETWQVTVTCRGSTCGTVNRTVERCWITGNAMVLNCDQNKRLNKEFFYHLMLGQDMSECITGTGQPQIVRSPLAAFRVGLPKQLSEQRAIATALSDVDALLGALEQLIAKKRDLKQAAMQQLLTGETRLPGFQGEWGIIQLGSLGTFLKGTGVKKDEAVSGDLPCIRYGEIYTHHHDVIRTFYSHISASVAAKATLLKAGDVLFAGSGETKKEIGKAVAFVDECEAFAGGDIVILRPAASDAKFLGYYLNSAQVQRQKASLGQGDAVVHISASALASIELLMPSLPEQTAIASVLSDMDAELAVLEQRLAKTRALKQGMMQELLTGRTRLV